MMKKLCYSIFSVLCLTLLFQYAFAGPGPAYSIKLKVKGLKDTTCYLAYHFGDKQYLKDTAKVDSKGAFTFEGKEKLPGGIYLVVLPDKRYFEIIVNEQNFSLETDTADYAKNMKVKGSVENQIFYDYLQFLNPKGEQIGKRTKALELAKNKEDSTAIRNEIKAISEQINEYRKTVIAANPNTFVSKIFKAMMPVELPKEMESQPDSIKYRWMKDHYFDHIDFSDDNIVRTPIYHEKLKDYFEHMLYPQVDSINKAADWLVAKTKGNKELFKYTVWYITTKHETSNLMGADAVFVHMAEKYYMTKQAFWVDSAALAKITERAVILKPLLIGKKAPDLMLPDSLNNYHRLHDIKAKFILLYFWDPNCGHCQKVTPKLYDVYLKYKDKGVAVYAVDIDRRVPEWNKFVHQHQLNWLNVYDPHYTVNFRNKYDIYATPVLYILNDKKEIIAKRISYDQADEIIGNALKRDTEKKK
ncbi:MAG: redoxin domain-containing protein [Cytophagaceae bacterium]